MMVYLTNLDGNVKLEFDFLKDLPDDFDAAKTKLEKWVPFVLNISALGKTIAITEDMQACMTVYEVEKIYNGLKNLLDGTGDAKDSLFRHYSSESFFEISAEYLHEDDCFFVTLWFIVAEYPGGRIDGYDIGFRFAVGKPEMNSFAEEFKNGFCALCPQCSF